MRISLIPVYVFEVANTKKNRYYFFDYTYNQTIQTPLSMPSIIFCTLLIVKYLFFDEKTVKNKYINSRFDWHIKNASSIKKY